MNHRPVPARLALAACCLALPTLAACSAAESGSASASTESTVAAATSTTAAAPAATGAPAPTSTTTVPASAPATSAPTTSPSPATVPPTGPNLPEPTFSTLPRESTAQGQPGTVSLAITEPIEVDGWAPVPVTCTTGQRRYTASFDSAAVTSRVMISASMTAAPYNGPGTYAGVGSATIVLADGTTTTVPLAAPVTVDADLSGTVTIDYTTPEGLGVSFTLQWFCS